MLGHSPLSAQPLSTLEASEVSADVIFREPLAFPVSPKRQIGYAHVACNLLVTTLAVAAAAVPFIQQLAGSSPTPKNQVVAQQFINPLLLGISASASTTPFVQQLSAGAPGSKVQVFIPEAPPRLIGKTLPDYGPVGDGVSDSSPRIAKPVQVDTYPRLIGKTLPDYGAIGQQVSDSAPAVKAAVYAENRSSQLATGLPSGVIEAIPQGIQLADSAATRKPSVSVDVFENLLETTLAPVSAAAMPIGSRVSESAPPSKYNLRAPLFPERIEAPSAVVPDAPPIGVQLYDGSPPRKAQVRFDTFPDNVLLGITPATVNDIPVGRNWYASATPRKFQIRTDEYPNTLILGIPTDESPAAAFFGGNAELPRNPQVDVYPNLLGTTLAVQGQEIPVGKQWFASIPAPKYAVTAYNSQSLLTTGIPVFAAPIGLQVSASSSPPKFAVQVDCYPNLASSLYSVPQPVGGRVDASSPTTKFAVQVDSYPNPAIPGIPTIQPPLPPLGLPVDVSQWQGKYAVYDLNLLWPNSQIPNEILPPVVVPDEIRHRGGGYKKHRKAHYEERLPSQYKRLEEMVDDVSAEMAFKQIEATAPVDVKQQAKSILRLFAPAKSLVKADTVDWAAVEADATKIGALLALWAAERRRLELVDDDEEWMMWE